jgi:hypothetical protein
VSESVLIRPLSSICEPGLVTEAIPGVGVFPIWMVVMVAIAIWGTARLTLT